MRPRISTLRIAAQLFRLHVLGWRQVPGWTVVRREPGGDIYIALQLTTDPDIIYRREVSA